VGRRLQTRMRLCDPLVAHLRGLILHNLLLLLPEKLGPERIRGDATNKSAQNFQPEEMRLKNRFGRIRLKCTYHLALSASVSAKNEILWFPEKSSLKDFSTPHGPSNSSS